MLTSAQHLCPLTSIHCLSPRITLHFLENPPNRCRILADFLGLKLLALRWQLPWVKFPLTGHPIVKVPTVTDSFYQEPTLNKEGQGVCVCVYKSLQVFFFISLVLFMCVWTCMQMCILDACRVQGQKRMLYTLELEILLWTHCELPSGRWTLNSGPLQEQANADCRTFSPAALPCPTPPQPMLCLPFLSLSFFFFLKPTG